MYKYCRAHLTYLKYFVIHKYWIYRVGRIFNLSRWRIFKHDLSKLKPSEWFGYVHWKYDQLKYKGGGTLTNERKFGWAWFLHQKRNDHHWQYYMYTDDNGNTYPIEIPRLQVMELLTDWAAAGIVRFGEPYLQDFYEANKRKMKFHPNTEQFIINNIQQFEMRVLKIIRFPSEDPCL